MLVDLRISSEMSWAPSRLTTGRSTVYSFAAHLDSSLRIKKTETNKNMLYFPYLNHFRLRQPFVDIFIKYILHWNWKRTYPGRTFGGAGNHPPRFETHSYIFGYTKDAEDKKNEIPKEISSFFEWNLKMLLECHFFGKSKCYLPNHSNLATIKGPWVHLAAPNPRNVGAWQVNWKSAELQKNAVWTRTLTKVFDVFGSW